MAQCKESACQCGRHGFDPGRRKIPRASEQLSPCTTAIEPVLQSREPQQPSPRATTTEAGAPTACALQQEKPPQ